MKFTSPKNRRSQIAVIITFVIAVIFLFIAVFINLAKVSQVKTTTSTAADKAALGLASQLGSMSNYYKEKVLKGAGTEEKTTEGKEFLQACDTSWISFGGELILSVLNYIAAPFVSPATLIAISGPMSSGINNKFREMTGYNGLRENALYQALASTQNDDVEVKVTATPGIFYDDTNNNGVFDAAVEPRYDLRDFSAMLNEKKISRFAAWYYALRIPLVEDEAVKNGINDFLNGTSSVWGLKSFIDVDDRGANNNIIKLSYVLEQLPVHTGLDKYEITCNMEAPNKCPDWVKDKDSKKLRMMRIDSSNAVYGGFIDDSSTVHTLKNLLTRLNSQYPGTFTIVDLDYLKEDLRMFLVKCEEVLNLPVSLRLNGLSGWFPSFYDFSKHKFDRSSVDNPEGQTPADFFTSNKDAFNTAYSYDVYLRLIRDQAYIDDWVKKLEELDTTVTTGIRDAIASKHGECTWGRGPAVSSACNGFYGKNCDSCGEIRCSDKSGSWRCGCYACCYGPISPCAWEGTYSTCDQDPPVCNSSKGDLYGAVPVWCSFHANHSGCNSSCGCDVTNFDTSTGGAKDFQGQLSWRSSVAGQFDGMDKPTEVEQAIRILRALSVSLNRIKPIISTFANLVEKQLPSRLAEPWTDTNKNGVIDPGEFTDLNGDGVYTATLPEFYKRIKITYAWKDKPKPDGGAQFSHLVAVRIDGYPENLPNITESADWGWDWGSFIPYPRKCRQLNDYKGEFTITTWRYDQDQPTDIGKTDKGGWNLRRRKQGPPSAAGKEFSPESLGVIVADIQNDGKLDSSVTEAVVQYVLDSYAITSCSKAHYGPEKSNIYITGTKCD